MESVRLPNADFWRDKKVFVTGHTGFKGGWLALWLEQLGAVVTGYALAPDQHPNLCELAGVEATMRSVRGDIRDRATLVGAVKAAAPEVVFHLAAQPLVRRSYVEPTLTFETNVLGTVNILEAVRATPTVTTVVAITTDKVYENKEWVWAYRESDRLGGYDPYSSSKVCSELVISSWRQSFFAGSRAIAVSSARAGNVIGGGDWSEDRLIPDCIKAFQKLQKVVIRNPHATRPWQHVLEPLGGYLLLAEKMAEDRIAYSTAWNFGPELADVKPVGWIVDRLVSEWGGEASWSLEDEGQPHEASLLAVDATFARARLGWSPRFSLPEALERTVNWYRRLADGVPARDLVVDDILCYQSK